MIQSLKPPLNQLSLSIIPATLSSSLYVYLHGTHIAQVKIRKIIPERKAQTGCILLFIRKIKKDKKNRKDSYSNWNGNDDQLKREEEILGFECWILDGWTSSEWDPESGISQRHFSTSKLFFVSHNKDSS
ncbi:hypothetical protein Pst134EA_029315 [Puccinia striiformis f. sp. tritici]|uniref:hypothetical protein n=1 Tax=Puccinia striiformis f. sp. tritici TaxID=168172 RepID=UPI0020072BFF|nr:hypothetical protein Pst134EA_029315 [Puccinia striiformis f. sp. tritici]KAH9447281.1 hypothetical protein Pst134EA_029315 [Puccinia striiformis f. sp. tritici]